MIKYLGSKRTLIPQITSIVDALPDVRRVCDLFAGTTRVAQALKSRGYHVIANDIATYSYELALALIEADRDKLDIDRLRGWIAELTALPGYRGYYTKTFCEDARYFQPFNGIRIDAIRDAIDDLPANRHERAILLVSLVLAADRVDSTTGVQMAYLKQWAPRSHNPMELRLPDLLSGAGTAVREDAISLVEAGGTRDVDVTYVARRTTSTPTSATTTCGSRSSGTTSPRCTGSPRSAWTRTRTAACSTPHGSSTRRSPGS